MNMLLWIQIPRELAEEMMRDRLSTEQVTKTWMEIWRRICGSASVNVYVCGKTWKSRKPIRPSSAAMS
jgi:hypothetical protein